MVLLAVIGGYIITSLILLKYPNLIHKKKHLKFRAKHISHRGGAAERLENTMEAFAYAEKVGTDMFELDCHLTKDLQVVVSHDDHLRRTCGSQVQISQTLYKDLPKLQDGIKVDFYQTLRGRGEDRRIPLLKEVFDEFPHMPINIDIKVDDDLLIQQVNDLVKQYNREEITAWGSRSDVVCQKLYRLNPRVPLFFSMRRVIHLMLLFWTGLLPFISIKESLLEIIMPGILLSSEGMFEVPVSSKARFIFWLLDKLLMRPALIKHLDKRGIQTYLWVLNREEDFERAFKLGAAGVMTDRILLLKDYLDKTGQQRGQGENLIPPRCV
ncbi:unnamed protein product [Candidula unifasciata]|uniref:GP-PDE domain-containing protein n=1 Tax=Candidula unifasciata TaxID=100452 RepID=A0A8S3Z9F1_9EUPU|nr:unnamed protein product [Candidula unifasciata]